MTVVYTPSPPHVCDLGTPEPCHDAPGTTRRCDCGRFWVAEKYPDVRSGQQRAGVFWRPEKRRERGRREKAHRAARMAPPPSVKELLAPPVAPDPVARMFLPGQPKASRPSSMVVLACRHLDPEEGVMRSGHVVTDEDEAALRTVLRFVASLQKAA